MMLYILVFDSDYVTYVYHNIVLSLKLQNQLI